MKRYKATFSNGVTVTSRAVTSDIKLAWCIMHDDHILFKGFASDRTSANKQIYNKLNNITGRADLASMQPYIKNRVDRYNRTHGVGSFEQYVREEEKKYKTEIVRVSK